MMLLGPTESVVVADRHRRSRPARRRSADRSRARHRHLRRADHRPARRSPTEVDAELDAAARRPARAQGSRGPRRARPERRLRARRHARAGGRDRQSRTRPSTSRSLSPTMRSTTWSSAHRQRRRDPDRPAHPVQRRQLRDRLPRLVADERVRTCQFGHHRRTPFSSAPPSPAPTPSLCSGSAPIGRRPRRPRGLPGARRRDSSACAV